MSLIVHQFLFPSFIEPNLSVFGYTLCFFILFFDSLFLFFYKERQRDFDFFLFFLSALFFVFLTLLMGEFSFLFFIFFLVFLQVFPLLLFGKVFLAFVFLLYLSLLFPIAFAWQGAGAFEERLSLAVLTNFVLFSIFVFSALFCFVLNLFQFKGESDSDPIDTGFKADSDLLLSLNFSKKLQPILNSLIKYFPEKEDKKESLSPQKGRRELKSLRQFMLDFIEFAELNKQSLSLETLDIKQILNESLDDMKAHKKRPDNLALDIEGFDSFKIKGAPLYLKKCFEHILVNSFEALQNEEKPAIKIYCLRQKNWVSIQFLDNGHGIEEEDVKKLFDPLFSKRFGLRGLGLSYVQKVIQAHAGEVRIEKVTQWTKVLVKLPLISTYYDRFDFLRLLKNRKKSA
ncbi:MAG: HAMP domain-containing sensor histidine kinase [Oligoflexia bacterium]|nr:HAMP domain-containing sensor histidine kinase [Oligoflexia bacterium]